MIFPWLLRSFFQFSYLVARFSHDFDSASLVNIWPNLNLLDIFFNKAVDVSLGKKLAVFLLIQHSLFREFIDKIKTLYNLHCFDHIQTTSTMIRSSLNLNVQMILSIQPWVAKSFHDFDYSCLVKTWFELSCSDISAIRWLNHLLNLV